MTIGIAAITGAATHIVTASDRMLSSDVYIQGTDDTLKARKIAKKWAVTFSANDANLFLPIINVANEALSARGEDHDLHGVQDVLLGAYVNLFDAEFTAQYLSRYNIASITAFRNSGLASFGADRFDRICNTIDEFDLGITLLAYGFDTKSTPHVFEVSNPGKVTNHDLLGYAVIGSGSFMALASLRRKKLPYDLDAMIYRLLEAKFSAETAPGVGKSTSLFTVGANGNDGSIGYGSIDAIRDIWESTLKETAPQAALDLISKLTRSSSSPR